MHALRCNRHIASLRRQTTCEYIREREETGSMWPRLLAIYFLHMGYREKCRRSVQWLPCILQLLRRDYTIRHCATYDSHSTHDGRTSLNSDGVDPIQHFRLIFGLEISANLWLNVNNNFAAEKTDSRD